MRQDRVEGGAKRRGESGGRVAQGRSRRSGCGGRWRWGWVAGGGRRHGCGGGGLVVFGRWRSVEGAFKCCTQPEDRTGWEGAATVQRERTQDKERKGEGDRREKGANEARKPAETYKSIICNYFCL